MRIRTRIGPSVQVREGKGELSGGKARAVTTAVTTQIWEAVTKGVNARQESKRRLPEEGRQKKWEQQRSSRERIEAQRCMGRDLCLYSRPMARSEGVDTRGLVFFNCAAVSDASI